MSSLLKRIVKSYRKRDFDKKLEKMGLAELKAQGSDYEDKGGIDEFSSGGKPSR
jgi:choline-phosphate cytidylyltransferase